MEKKNISKIAIVIVAITVILVAAGGATFAYWQWVSAENEQTAINVTVAQGINMTINPTIISTTTMYPTKGLNAAGEQDLDSHEAVMTSTALVTIENQTGIKARPKFMLKLQILSAGGTNITATGSTQAPTTNPNTNQTITGTSTAAHATFINYAVTEADGDCDNPITSGTFTADDEIGETGWYNSAYITNVGTETPIPFPKLTSTDTTSVAFEAPGYQTTTHTYKVCAWIDDSYTFTNVGDTATDPMQNATIKVSWSEESEVIQVTG